MAVVECLSMRRLCTRLVPALCLWAILPPSLAGEEAPEVPPRTLVLALDGVPLRSLEVAVEKGAFASWSRPRGMISPFPSMTSVAFTAILEPFCVHPIAGYETFYFNREQNKMIGGVSKEYLETYFSWRTHFLVRKRSYTSNVAGYTRPMHSARKMVEKIEGLVLGGTTDPIMAHVGPTDVVTHVRGDQPIIEFLLELNARLGELEAKHEKKWGRPLRIVMLSDHGNTQGGVDSARDLRHTLENAGFRVHKKLERPHDIVMPAYGAVSYSALYLDPSKSEEVAKLTLRNEAVDLAAWIRGPGEIGVASATGEAVIRWRSLSDSRRFSYDSGAGDPLQLAATRSDLGAAGLLDRDGLAGEEEWLRRTLDHRYPDPLRRLVDALQGTWVENPATVILSLHPERAWGSKKAWIGSFLMGGGLEGTHGALESESTMGFWIANERLPGAPEAVPADETLTRWFTAGDCVAMTRIE